MKKQILYVEDDAINALVMKKLLSDHGVRIAPDGETALLEAQNAHYPLVLMDINLGTDKMNGIDTMRQMKTIKGYEQVVFIAVTAYALPEDRQLFLDAGFDEYISKPIDTEKLRAILASFGFDLE